MHRRSHQRYFSAANLVSTISPMSTLFPTDTRHVQRQIAQLAGAGGQAGLVFNARNADQCECFREALKPMYACIYGIDKKQKKKK